MEAFVPQWGQCTNDIKISTFDDQQSATATENKDSEHAPTVRGPVNLPDDATAEWHFLLDQAKGLVLIGLEQSHLSLGAPFRKPENKDAVWYYTSDGILRNGARQVGQKVAAAQSGDMIIMKLENRKLTFFLNGELLESIPDIHGGALSCSVQMHRKGDRITLVKRVVITLPGLFFPSPPGAFGVESVR